MAKENIDRYLADIPDSELDLSLGFPPRGPYPFRERDADTLTTDFVLRYFSYNRGAMFQSYGMNFDALSKLHAARVATIIPALYGSDDEQLRLVAIRAIEGVPGTAFVGLVLDGMNDNPAAWRALAGPEDKETSSRLTALADMAQRRLSEWGRAWFWERMGRGECFHEVCVARAVEELEKIDRGRASKPDGARRSTARERELAGALREYLAAAMADREGKPAGSLTAAEYRDWFKAHPAQRREE